MYTYIAVVRTCTCYVRASTTTRACLYYDMCTPLHCPVCMFTIVARMTTLCTLRPGGPGYQALPCVRRCSWWVPAVRGRIIFFARTHFLACEDVAGRSQQSGGESFFLPGRTSLRAKVSLVGPNGQGGESFCFFARTHFLACEDVAGGSQQSGGNVFSRNTVARPVGPRCQVQE